MKKISSEAENVLKEISKYGPIRPSELIKKTSLSKKNVYKHLYNLLHDDKIKKIGTSPKVYYELITSGNEITPLVNTYNTNDLILEHNYIYVSPNGEIIRGVDGFNKWCNKNHFNYETEKHQLLQKLSEINKIKKHGIISANKIILSSKKQLYINNIFFSDFYTIDHFGKTKLGQLVYVGKSSQSKELIKEISRIIKPSIEYLIKKYEIKSICFIPPTIDRKLQFVDELKRNLQIKLPEIKAEKIYGITKIPQKSLRKLEDRIINASRTITVDPSQRIDGNILIIDDATGSGATINETAKKIRLITSNKVKIIGYSVVGSYKGFDVISEV